MESADYQPMQRSHVVKMLNRQVGSPHLCREKTIPGLSENTLTYTPRMRPMIDPFAGTLSYALTARKIGRSSVVAEKDEV